MKNRIKEIQIFQDKEIKREHFEISETHHADFANCPWIIVRYLNPSLSEGDLMTMCEQYGTIVSMELLRDQKTGHSRGMAIMAYEDPRSCILACDNFNGVNLCGRTINVDHIDFKPNAKSRQQDPRQITPARFQKKSTEDLPIFDEDSEPDTEDESS